jgi:hypothetical protein
VATLAAMTHGATRRRFVALSSVLLAAAFALGTAYRRLRAESSLLRLLCTICAPLALIWEGTLRMYYRT